MLLSFVKKNVNVKYTFNIRAGEVIAFIFALTLTKFFKTSNQ